MRIPGKNERREPPQDALAADDADREAQRATRLVGEVVGVEWYEANGTTVDEAALALCRLRRARAGLGGGPQRGDAAVRRVLESAPTDAVVWIASRAISYMDESGYPEAVERWFPPADVTAARE